MTKRLSLIMVLLVAIALVVAACGGAAPTQAPAVATEAPAVATEAPAVATEAPAVATEAPVAAFKVGQVTDVGGINDASFNELAWQGMQDAELDFGVEVNFLESQQQTD